jgi:SAM-dependent methyltransferase
MGTLMTGLSSLGWNPPARAGTGGAAPTVDYPDDARDPLAEIEDVSPWFTVRNRVIDTLLARAAPPAGLVEVGAGNGSVASHLESTGIDVIAVEPGAAGAANCRRRGLTTFDTSLEALHFPSGSLPAVGFFDVLEHLDDPGPIVREAHRALADDGLLVVTVPAFPLLWSQADEFAGHHRRYRAAALDALVVPVGFRRVACSYYFALGVPFALVRRALPFRLGRRRSHEAMISDSVRELDPPGRLAPSLIRRAGALETRLIAAKVRIPLGTSLGAVYRRQRSGRSR